jgi:CRISPR system Cascade subunit CasE
MTGNPLWLSRLRIRPEPDVRRLAARLMPDDDEGARAGAQHQLVWDVFADDPDRRRDFLWREVGVGELMALSSRPPLPGTALFAVESRPFAPVLQVGDALRFTLRANATTGSPGSKADGRRGARFDVAMAALHAVPTGARAEVRDGVAAEAGVAWLRRQGERAGFALPENDELIVSGYRVVRIRRGGDSRGSAATFGVFDFEGVLAVTDPGSFLAAVARGFGRAKAFGFGLMLIARAV